MKKIIRFFKSKAFQRFLTALAAYICIFTTGVEVGIVIFKWRYSVSNIAYPTFSGIASLILGIYYLYLLTKGK